MTNITNAEVKTYTALALCGDLSIPLDIPASVVISSALAVYDGEEAVPRDPVFRIDMDGTIFLRGNVIGHDEGVARLIASAIKRSHGST